MPWVHFIAVGGTGMGAVAGLMKDLGWTVTGSDGPLYPPMSDFLKIKEIPVRAYDVANLQASSWGLSHLKQMHPDLVVVGNAISRGHVEAEVVEHLLVQQLTRRMSFPEALAEFCIQDRESFVVAGTHGKSTTSTLLAWAMQSQGYEPSFLIGGIPKNFSSGCRTTASQVFVAEGDEYDTAYWDKESKFLHYRAHWVLCTGIELDHVDIYGSVEAIENSFLKLITKTKVGWVLVDAESAPRASSVERVAGELRRLDKKIVRYGRAKSSHYQLVSVEGARLPWDEVQYGTRITLHVPSAKAPWTVYTSMVGRHNALNILGVLALMRESGKLSSQDQAQQWLRTFSGIKRRQDEVYRDSELIIVDDFAHHPTAISETILAIRQKYPQAKIAAFFEPRSASSARNVFQKEFSLCFDRADAVFLTPPTKINIPQDQKLDVNHIARSFQDRTQHPAFVNADMNGLAKQFFDWKAQVTSPTSPAVALVMSNGPFGGIHQMLMSNAQTHSSKKGQAALEYLLILAAIITVAIAAFSGPLRDFFGNAKGQMETSLTDVVSQRELGIPLAWFQGDGYTTGPRSRGPGQDGAGTGDGNSENADQGNGSGAGAGGAGGLGGGRNGESGADGNQDGRTGRGQGADAQDGEGGGETSTVGGAPSGRRGRRVGASGTGNNSVSIEEGNDASSGARGADTAEEANFIRAREREIAAQKAREEAGCQSMNLFTLIKVGAIIALVILIVGAGINKKGNRTAE